MLVPAAVIAASRSFTVASVAMSAPFQICLKSVVLYCVHLAKAPYVAFLAAERRAGEGLDQLGRDRRPDDAPADPQGHVGVVVVRSEIDGLVAGRLQRRDHRLAKRDACVVEGAPNLHAFAAASSSVKA